MTAIDKEDKITKQNGWFLFGIIVLCYLLFTFISNQYLFGEEVYIRSFSDQLTLQNIEALWDLQEQYLWLSYVFLPLIVLLKVFFATVYISIGAVLSNIKFKFKIIFRATLLAEVVFIVAQVLYLVNLSFRLDSLTLETASAYYPFSFLSLIDANQVVSWLQYPLQTLNLFEVAYMVVIAWLLSKHWKEDFMESLAVVVPSYATGLLLWLVFVTFVTLQVT